MACEQDLGETGIGMMDFIVYSIPAFRQVE